MRPAKLRTDGLTEPEDERAEMLTRMVEAFSRAVTPEQIAAGLRANADGLLAGASVQVYCVDENERSLTELAAPVDRGGGQPSPASAAPFLATEVARDGRAGWFTSFEELSRAYPSRPEQTAASPWHPIAALPLESEGDRLGVLILQFARPQPFTADDRATHEWLAGNLAAALARARLHARTAQEVARLRMAADVSAALAAAASEEEALQQVGRLVTGAFAELCMFTLRLEDGGETVVYLPPEAARRPLPDSDQGQVVVIPLRSREQTLGSVTFFAAPLRRFTDVDRAVAADLAARVALTLDNLRLLARARAAHERFELATRAVNGLVYDWDVRRNRVFRSKGLAQLVGLADEALENTTDGWSALIHPEDREAVWYAFRHAVETGLESYELEYRIRRADGDYVHVCDRPFLIRDEQNQLVRYVGFTTDITRWKHAENELERTVGQLRETIKAVDIMLGVLGHDLRNPLNAVLMAGTLLKRELDGERHKKLASRIVDSTQRMARLVRDLLDFAALRSGKVALVRKHTDLHRIAVSIVEEAEVGATGLKILVDVDGDGRGFWDEDRIAQVVSNLVANALQHGAPDQPISMRVTDLGDRVRLTVRNFGPPIPPESQAAIFEPFRRTPGAAGPTASRSVGLGLFIARQFVAAHGGEIRVLSSTETGTVFEFDLPRT